MAGRDPGGGAQFFLPVGAVGVLEEEVFYLCEMLHLSYTDVMRIPWSRRKRLVESKLDLERKREAAQKQAAQVAARRRRAR